MPLPSDEALLADEAGVEFGTSDADVASSDDGLVLDEANDAGLIGTIGLSFGCS